MNDLQIFNHPLFGEVRWVEVDGKPGAVGLDITKALGYAKPSQAVIDHCKGIRKLGIPSEGGIQETNIIFEGDIYRLIIKAADQSKNEEIKANAEVFEKWVFNDVIPSIRKTGSYSVESESSRKSLSQPNLSKIAKSLKASIDIAVALGMPLHQARLKAIEITELEYNVDLSEFQPAPSVMISTGKYNIDLTLILEAIHAVITNGWVHRDFGGGSYALNRDQVYRELDARGLHRIRSLASLCRAGILEKGNRHYTKHFRIGKNNVTRAVFVRMGS